MRIPRIYIDQALYYQKTLVLSEDKHHYLTRVLRLKIGAKLIIFDGKDNCFLGVILRIDGRKLYIELQQDLSYSKESSLYISLGQVISRGDRFDWVIQKATELGVDEITVLYSERSEVRLSKDREKNRFIHWKNIAISACEQCGRNMLPNICGPIFLEEWLNNRKTEKNYIFHTQADPGIFDGNKPKSVSLLIGPEGGITFEELTMAKHYNFQAVQLGPRVLRTETAPIVGISLMQFLWGDLSE